MLAATRGIESRTSSWSTTSGLEAARYRWPDLRARFGRGALREDLYRVALEQGLARDAAFVVIGAADVAALDDREYREAHLAAGLVEGRLHLLAYGLGASASGMTFIDSEVPRCSASRSTRCCSPVSACPSTRRRPAACLVRRRKCGRDTAGS